jgi:hypothetical protein
VKNEQDQNADSHRRISNIEDRPAREMVPEDGHVKEINIDEIYDFAVKQSPVVKQNTVKDTVDEVADRASEDERKRKTEQQPLVSHFV